MNDAISQKKIMSKHLSYTIHSKWLETKIEPKFCKTYSVEEGDDMIENTPEAVVAQPGDAEVSKKRKLFKLKAHSSKVGNLFGASTTSLISGNLDKKASKIHSPPKCEEAKKRPLTPDNT